MGIGKKLFIIVFIVACVLGVVVFSIQRSIVFNSFIELEEQEAKKDVERCLEAINREAQHLKVLAFDWAYWDDSYNFINDFNDEFLDSNFRGEELQGASNVDLIFFLDIQASVHWYSIPDPDSGTQIMLPPFKIDQWDLDNPLFINNKDYQSFSGLLLTKKGAILVASVNVLHSTGVGESNGTLVIGRFLDEETYEQLAMQTRVDFSAWPVIEGGASSQQSDVLDQLGQQEALSLISEDKKYLTVYGTVDDVYGNTALLIEARVPRNITTHGLSAERTSLVFMTLMAIVLFIILYAFLHKTLVTPLSKLTSHVKGINASEDMTQRLDIQQNDEIGILADEFNHMQIRLEEDHQMRKQMENTLRELATQDSLTEVANRRSFDAVLSREVQRAARRKDSISLIMVDIDHFKQYNDEYGHQSGDEALRMVARTLKEGMSRASDFVARYGGEEFVIILPNTMAREAHLVADILRTGVEALNIPHELSETAPHITISLGVSSQIPSHAYIVDDLLKEADKAMYEAKKQGRNRVISSYTEEN